MTSLAHAPDAAEALPLGPRSLVWRYFGDNRMFLIGPRPAVLQNMLAELGQGVLDHSVFFDDTAARVKRSLPPIFNTVYGSDTDHPGQQVRDFHHQIKGDMPDGGRYHALDPETYFWAHATFVEQVLFFADTFVKRLTRAEKEQIYLESKTWYRRYGVSDRPPAFSAPFSRAGGRHVAGRSGRRHEMNILVTGISGYVGSRLVPALLREGHSVSGLSRHPERLRGEAGARGSVKLPEDVHVLEATR